MTDSHRRKLEEIDPYKINVRFSPRVKKALADLEAAVHFSEHFDGDAYAMLHGWAHGKAPTVREVLVEFPLIASETFQHIRATNDKRAEEAWDQLSSELLEAGFALTQRTRER